MSLLYLEPILLDDVSTEADRARSKFGDQFHLTDTEWLAVLAEEFGEAAQLVTKMCVPPITNPELTLDTLREEVVQISATAARWIAALDHR